MEIVKLTEEAQSQALRLKNSQASTKDGLRIAVIGGGCAGLQHKISFSDATEVDFLYEYPSGLVVLVDPKSAVLLQGSTVDFHNELDRSGFEVKNPASTGGCGCGKSFSV